MRDQPEIEQRKRRYKRYARGFMIGSIVLAFTYLGLKETNASAIWINLAFVAVCLMFVLSVPVYIQYARLDRDSRRAGVSQPKPRQSEAAVLIGLAVILIGLGAWYVSQGLVPIAVFMFAAGMGTLSAVWFRARVSRNL